MRVYVLHKANTRCIWYSSLLIFLSNCRVVYRPVSNLSFISKLTKHKHGFVRWINYHMNLTYNVIHASLVLPSSTQPKPFLLPFK